MDVPEKEAAITRILEELRNGKSLVKACEVEGKIKRPTFLLWVKNDKDGLSDKYTHAREIGYQCMADDIDGIADDTDESSEGIAKSKLRIDTKKWLLSKMLPKNFGDKQEIKHKGTPISVNVVKPDGAD